MCTLEENSCNIEPDSGPCRASKPRYNFDKNDKSCKTFLYGGCDGNRNNFLTERDCFAACGDNPTIVQNRSDGTYVYFDIVITKVCISFFAKVFSKKYLDCNLEMAHIIKA